jgi:hypothetical protein
VNEIERALAQGVSPVLLQTAAHEVGHGLAFTLAGLRVTKMTAQVGWFGGRNGGTWIDPDSFTPALSAGYLVGLRAGQAAHYRFLRRYLGHSHSDATRRAEADGRGDMAIYREQAEPGDVRPGLALSRAQTLVNRYGGRLDRATVRLGRAGSMSGGAL